MLTDYAGQSKAVDQWSSQRRSSATDKGVEYQLHKRNVSRVSHDGISQYSKSYINSKEDRIRRNRQYDNHLQENKKFDNKFQKQEQRDSESKFPLTFPTRKVPEKITYVNKVERHRHQRASRKHLPRGKRRAGKNDKMKGESLLVAASKSLLSGIKNALGKA